VPEQQNVKHTSRSALQIAIDGPSASGKSTLGRAIADSLGCRFLDTGQMYRAVTFKALLQGVSATDATALGRIAQDLEFELSDDGLLVDGSPVRPELHSSEVDSAVSAVSAHPSVRSVFVRRQREMASGDCIVMVGRDIGTTVLPEAPVKLWVTASDVERARRRARDQPEHVLLEGHDSARSKLGARDRFDSTRAHSPLQKAPDAIFVNTDGRSPGQVLSQALAAIRAASEDGPS
jgi:cytidylate kinase